MRAARALPLSSWSLLWRQPRQSAARGVGALGRSPCERTVADWGLLWVWVWSKPEVSVVLSGIRNITQVVENLVSAHLLSPWLLSPAESEVVSRVAAAYKKLARPLHAVQLLHALSKRNIQQVLDICNKSVDRSSSAEVAESKAGVWLLALRAVGLPGQILQEESQKPRKGIP